jgi:hypothetical protein
MIFKGDGLFPIGISREYVVIEIFDMRCGKKCFWIICMHMGVRDKGLYLVIRFET